MKATVTFPMLGVPDGSVYPVQYKVGDTVEGDLAREAIAGGWGEAEGKAKRSKSAPVEPAPAAPIVDPDAGA
jgi:hypothetical protein